MPQWIVALLVPLLPLLWAWASERLSAEKRLLARIKSDQAVFEKLPPGTSADEMQAQIDRAISDLVDMREERQPDVLYHRVRRNRFQLWLVDQLPIVISMVLAGGVALWAGIAAAR